MVVEQTSDEVRRKKRTKNWVMFAVLLAFVVIVYVVAIVRMSGG